MFNLFVKFPIWVKRLEDYKYLHRPIQDISQASLDLYQSTCLNNLGYIHFGYEKYSVLSMILKSAKTRLL